MEGNIRELQQALNLGQALSTQELSMLNTLPEDIKVQNDTGGGPWRGGGTLAAAEREAVRCVLRNTITTSVPQLEN